MGVWLPGEQRWKERGLGRTFSGLDVLVAGLKDREQEARLRPFWTIFWASRSACSFVNRANGYWLLGIVHRGGSGSLQSFGRTRAER